MQRAGFLLGWQTGRPARQLVLLRPQGGPVGPTLRTALGKETLQQLSALIGQQPPLHHRLMGLTGSPLWAVVCLVLMQSASLAGGLMVYARLS